MQVLGKWVNSCLPQETNYKIQCNPADKKKQISFTILIANLELRPEEDLKMKSALSSWNVKGNNQIMVEIIHNFNFKFSWFCLHMYSVVLFVSNTFVNKIAQEADIPNSENIFHSCFIPGKFKSRTNSLISLQWLIL